MLARENPPDRNKIAAWCWEENIGISTRPRRSNAEGNSANENLPSLFRLAMRAHQESWLSKQSYCQ